MIKFLLQLKTHFIFHKKAVQNSGLLTCFNRFQKKLICIFVALILGAALYGFIKPAKDQPEVRMHADTEPVSVSGKDVPAHIENLSNNGHILAIRSSANNAPIPNSLLAALQFIDEAFEKPQPKQQQKDFTQLAPLLQPDGGSTPRLFVSAPYADALDLTGAPLRWRLPENLLAGYSVPKNYPVFIEPEKLAPIPKLPQTASSYQGLVQNFAKRFNLSVPLVMAIIHSESDFSPTLVSTKSAMGLMQLLPSTASGEVHRFLYGRNGNVGFEDLRIPEINIHYGTAYLHILLNRYFSQIEDREVREICAIAAYNLGPNRFVKLYGPTPEAAAREINAMGKDAFLEDLPKRLPTRETRTYVEKVRRMKNHYAGLY